MAALDTYFHWAIADAPLVNMPSALRNLEIPFEDLIALSEAMVANREKIGPYPRILDTVGDYAAVGSVAARRAS